LQQYSLGVAPIICRNTCERCARSEIVELAGEPDIRIRLADIDPRVETMRCSNR
jgi:hypothetical protein